MVTRKEDTPKRLASRKYEEKNKGKRKATSGNFQTMIPRELFEKINAFLNTVIPKLSLYRRAMKNYLQGKIPILQSSKTGMTISSQANWNNSKNKNNFNS